MKTCRKCQVRKEDDCFYFRHDSVDGLTGVCVECRVAQVHTYREKNLAAVRLRESNSYIEKMKNPAERAKIKACAHLREKVRWGKIIRPKSCSACGVEGCRIVAHHEDYSKPLEVLWLCDKCHGLKNRKESRQGVKHKWRNQPQSL